ncbi:TPA: polysaccharide deacetylase [Bacillus cereus]|nr:polysaccharide deacetylase [Bacillus cereus]
METVLKVKNVVVISVTMVVVGCAFFILQSITSPASAIAGQKNPVQHANEQIKVDMNKVAPTQFNGQTRKIAYLTFDDGPGKYTAQLLDILKENDVKATFFLIGQNVKSYPNLVKREVVEGHYIGMHSMTHNSKKLYDQGGYVDDMKEEQDLIASILGYSPKLTRPPYGSKTGLHEELRNKVVESGLKVWDWTIDSLDWTYNSVSTETAIAQITQKILADANGPKEVILMHDIHSQSIAAVPAIIKGLKEKGYEFEAYHEFDHFPVNFMHDQRI